MNAKARSHLKLLAILLGTCAVFTAGRLIAEKYWGLTYDTRTIEILIGILLVLHLGVPYAAKKFFKKGEAASGGSPSSGSMSEKHV